MARSPKRRNPPGSPSVDPEQSPPKNPEEVGGSESASLFDAEGDSRVALYRMDDAKKKMIFHGYLETADATEAAVSALFGGGKYRAQLRVADELGREVIKRSRDFTLPGAYRPPTTLPGVASAGGAPATPVAASTQPLASGEALNTALVSQVIDMLTKMREPKQTMDWTPIITAVTSLLTTVLTAVLTRPKDDNLARIVDAMNERMDKLAEMLAAQQRAAAAGPASGAMADAVKAVRELLDVKEMLEGGGGEKSDPTDAMLLALPKLIDRMTTPPAAAAPQRKPVSPVPPNAAPWQRFLLANKGRLMQFASMGMEPDLTAELALRFVSPQVAGVVREFLSKPDAAEQAMLTIPELRGYEQWTRDFVKEAHAQFFGEDEDEEELGGEDVTDAEDDDAPPA